MRPPFIARAVAALLALCVAAPSADARADGLPEATVHLRTPRVTLELRPNGDHAWQVGCAAPCDVRVPALYEYRIAGRGIEPSKPFRVEASTVEIFADPGDRTVHTIGTAFDIIGGLAIIGGIFYVIIGTASDSSNGVDGGQAFKDRATDGIALTTLIGGVALSITGAIMQAASETEVVQKPLLPVVHPLPDPRPEPRANLAPRALTFPIVSTRF